MAVGDVKARIVRSDGQELTIGDGEWRIPSDGLVNWANLPYSVASSEIPSYDGALVTSKRVGAVDRSISAVVWRPSDNERLRNAAVAFFNPKYSFDVHMTYMGRTRWCHGEQIGFKASEGNIYEPARIDWTILCPNPFMQSEGDFGRDIAEVAARFAFPFLSPLPASDGSVPGFGRGFIASLHMFGQEVEIDNDGDVPSGLVLRIRAKGDVENPIVRVGGAKLRVLAKMSEGDELLLDASSRPPKLTMNGNLAMNLIDRTSNILDMMVEVGGTTIAYDADDGESNMEVFVRYNKQYLGV